MNIVLGIAGFGVLLSLLAHGCVEGFIKDPKDSRLFGKIHFAWIAILGYALIAFYSSNLPILNILAGITAVFTIYLMVRAYKIGLSCPICPAVWILNTVLVFVVIFIQ